MLLLDSGPRAALRGRLYRSWLSPSLVSRTGCTVAWRAGSVWRATRGPVIAALLMALAIVDCGRPPAPTPPAIAASDSANLLRPGDLIRLKIWREPDLSGDFAVDQMGTVVLPKLGPMTVTKQSPESLRERLITAYQVYLNHPSIDVMFLRRVQVLGAVRNPGLYPVDPTMTLGDAVALAGGATTDGNPDRVKLIRDGVTLSGGLSHGARVGESQVRSGDQIFVPERSWISRNPGILATYITAGVGLFIALQHTR